VYAKVRKLPQPLMESYRTAPICAEVWDKKCPIAILNDRQLPYFRRLANNRASAN